MISCPDIPVIHPASLASKVLLNDCDVRFARRSGPGGQNRNKVETAAILTHRPSGLAAEANEKRSQSQNRETALFRLRIILALKIRTVREPNDIPSVLWKSRFPKGRLAINPRHEEFPAILAEALDVIALQSGDLRASAEALCSTSSQLIKLLKDEPKAFLFFNEDRRARGLPVLS